MGSGRPESLFADKVWTQRRIRPDENELAEAIALLKAARKPMIIAGGGVLYSGAMAELIDFAETHRIPVAVTQAGKSAIDETHKLALGAIGVTGTSAANALAADTDLILAVGTRFQDFTTGSWALFKTGELKIVALNVTPYDSVKHNAAPLIADAKVGLKLLSQGLGGWTAAGVADRAADERTAWFEAAGRALAPTNAEKPSDAQVIGAVARTLGKTNAVVVCAAGGLPGELENALEASRKNDRTTVIVIETHPLITTEAGGYWWDVVVPEVSPREEVSKARQRYEADRRQQRVFD